MTAARDPRLMERQALNVPPGGWAVETQRPIATLLGSCVSVCLWDPARALGGLNHFMLPEWRERGGREVDALLCGDHAMEVLLNALLARGVDRRRLQAKMFGGGSIVHSLSGKPVGERNVAFAKTWLEREGIPVLASDLMGPWARKLLFDPVTGDAYCRRTEASRKQLEVESQYGRSLGERKRTNVELF